MTEAQEDHGVQLRISVAFSGGASLGAYEAGALAALLVGVQHLHRQRPGTVMVDAMGGASAGSIVALLGAHALLEGIDALDLLHEAWVERVSLQLLRRGPGQGLLAFDRLREDITDLLESVEGSARRRQESPLGLHVALTGLQGLTYPVHSLGRGDKFSGVTYADWGRFLLKPGKGPRQMIEPSGISPLDFVLASASHPGAFRPALLDRSGDQDVYARLGIDNFPESGQMWYTDGGIGQSAPLGRVLGVARWADRKAGHEGPFRRALVLIDPRSEDPSGARSWSDPTQSPKWLRGLSRALEIVPTQAIYDDALRVEKTNTRRKWADDLAEKIASQIDESGEDVLRDFLEGVRRDRAQSPKRSAEWKPRQGSARELVREALNEVTGLRDKEVVDLNVITPRQVARGQEDEVPQLLAGEFFADFGGFLDRDTRRSDFLLGYASIDEWLPTGLEDSGFGPANIEMMAEEIARRSPGDWRKANRGGFGPRDLDWRGRLGLAQLGFDATRALAAHVVDVSRIRTRFNHFRRTR